MRYIRPAAFVALVLAVLALLPVGLAAPWLALAVIVLCIGILLP